MELTRCLLPLALFVLLLVDPANRGQFALIAAALVLFLINAALTFGPARWGRLPCSRSFEADMARVANLLLIAGVGLFAFVQPGPLALLIVLALDSLIRRFLHIGAIIGVTLGLSVFLIVVAPRSLYDYLWVATLIALIALHRIIVSVQAMRRREELIASHELYAKEAQQLERLVVLIEEVLGNRDVRASLHAIAVAVQEVFHFKYVSIVTRDDASGTLRRSVLLGVPQNTLAEHLKTPVDFKKLLPHLSPEFEVAPNCYFVPAEATHDDEAISIYLGDLPRDGPRDGPRAAPDAWHERDVLLLVLCDEEKRIVGYMSVHSPLDGKIPAKHTLLSMQIFVNLVGLALATTASRVAHIERNRILEEAGRLQNEFLSMVSHEVRSPLATIRGASNLLQTRHGDLSEGRRAELLGALGSATLRLNRIFEDLLLISQMDAGQLRLRPEDVQPRYIVEEAVRQILMEHPGRAITLLAPPDIPTVRADEGRMSQIVNNLLSNAAKYSDEHTIITASIVVLDDAVRVSVTNEGPGIAPEDRVKLFTRFGSLSDATTSTGLGLYICKQLIDPMGGTISCESDPGASTTFAFTLPRSQT